MGGMCGKATFANFVEWPQPLDRGAGPAAAVNADDVQDSETDSDDDLALVPQQQPRPLPEPERDAGGLMPGVLAERHGGPLPAPEFPADAPRQGGGASEAAGPEFRFFARFPSNLLRNVASGLALAEVPNFLAGLGTAGAAGDLYADRRVVSLGGSALKAWLNALKGPSTVQALHCSIDTLTDADIAKMGARCPDLRHLRLGTWVGASRCLLTPSAWAHVAAMSSLEALDVLIPCSGHELMSRIRGMERLQHLGLAGRVELADGDLRLLSQFTSLRSLLLDRCRAFSAEAMAQLGTLHRLERLVLSGADAGTAMALLLKLEALRELDLADGCNFSVEGLASLPCAASLERLELFETHHMIMSHLERMREQHFPSLREVVMPSGHTGRYDPVRRGATPPHEPATRGLDD